MATVGLLGSDLKRCRGQRRADRGEPGRLSGRTLEKHRTYGTGPLYSKLGGRVVYRIDDLQAWVNRGAKASTSDETGQSVSPAKPHAAPLARYAGQPHR